MAGANVLEFTDTNFDTEVLQSKEPVLVDFWAVWCGPCRMIAPMVDALGDEYKGRVKVGKVDTDSNRQTAMRFQIQAIPTLMIFKNGQLIQRYQGGRPKKELAAALDAALGAPATA